MPSPVVSIVIPVLNGETTIALTVESALRQSCAESVEVIVVDNGSTDRTREIVARYPVRLVEESQRGRSAARNRGRHESRAEILGFVDADCEVPPTWIEHSRAMLEQPWIGAVQARIQKRGLPPPARDFVHARWYLPFLDTCALVTTARAFDDANGFDLELRRNVDMDFSFRLLGAGYALAVLPDDVAIKHHDLGYRQILRRGWDGGASLALVDKKWRALCPPARRRYLDTATTWVRRGILGALRAAAPGHEFVEQTTRVVAYVAMELAGTAEPHRLDPATALAGVLGPHRCLVVSPDEARVFDRKQRSILRLDAQEAAALASLARGASMDWQVPEAENTASRARPAHTPAALDRVRRMLAS